MSGNKNGGGLAHQVLDKLAKFEISWSTKMGELVKKHNDMCTQNAALETMVKSLASALITELGKSNGTTQATFEQVSHSLSRIDLNVLALADVVQEIFGQLAQIDVVFQQVHSSTTKLMDSIFPNEEGRVTAVVREDLVAFNTALEIAEAKIEEIKTEAKNRYDATVAAAFRAVQDRLLAQELAARKQREEEEQKAKEEAEKAVAAKAEAETVEQELQKAATDDRSVVASTPGGPGSDIHEGAEIFGG